MAKRLDHLIVIDIEATCWPGPPPAGEVSEVIEVGVCPIDLTTLTRLEKRSILVRPERSTVSAFCTELTTLTPELVATGVSFREACRVLKKEYLTEERCWASCGDYDRTQFERQCRDTGVGYPFGRSHVNVKTLLGLTRALPHEVGLAQALELLGLPLEGTHHRGHDDAWNIAALTVELLKRLRAVA